MLILYYSPLSPNARRVWVSLLEKGLAFDLKPLSLKGDQRQPEFIAINPFQQIPVLVDNGFTIVESFAILDYLEARYPEPSFLPTDPQSLAIVRMVEQLTDNKLLYTLGTLIAPDIASPAYDRALEIVNRTLAFWEKCLTGNCYFGGDRLSLGDIVAGTTLPLFLRLGIRLDPYPQLATWIAQLQSRSSWKQTELSEESWREFKRRIRVLIMMQNKRKIGN
jgi:glutathione S-transferase